jgi:hypothetical protein
MKLIAESKTDRVWEDEESGNFSIERAEVYTVRLLVPELLDDAQEAIFIRAGKDLAKLAIEKALGEPAAGANETYETAEDHPGFRWLRVTRAYWPA